MFVDRKPLIEVDFVNGYFVKPQDAVFSDTEGNVPAFKKYTIPDSILEKLFTKLDTFWHTDKDKIEYFQYYSDGNYFCQRSKKKVDFNTESTYWNQYQFDSATKDQALEFYDFLFGVFAVINEIKNLKVEAKVNEVDKEVLFYEQRFYKIKRQKESMLLSSDWRILPDVEDSYEGEKDRWIAWRRWLRNNSTPAPWDEQFEGSGLAYFKYTYELKFPVDPKVYRKLYPNEMLDDGVTPAPAFMDENDPNQWVKHDSEASSDFFTGTEQNMYNLAGRGYAPNRLVTQQLLDLMHELDVESVIPVDWDRYVLNEADL